MGAGASMELPQDGRTRFSEKSVREILRKHVCYNHFNEGIIGDYFAAAPKDCDDMVSRDVLSRLMREAERAHAGSAAPFVASIVDAAGGAVAGGQGGALLLGEAQEQSEGVSTECGELGEGGIGGGARRVAEVARTSPLALGKAMKALGELSRVARESETLSFTRLDAAYATFVEE